MSSSDIAIRLENVSKSYRHYAQPLDRLTELFTRQTRHVDRVSVDNVSLEIKRGEVLGIIGQNGAGKSTLLKMIAGRLEPTSGNLDIRGSIAAILELGTGFHPEFSGRENVRMGGLCLGMSRRDVEREMDNIIAFSELEDVIDMPFRTYSSGMQARLTFATAVSVNPDILIIDEALSVGDARFQLKSFNRIRKFKEEGKTILLVSHSMGSVTSFCDRAVLLHKGRVLTEGDPNRVTSIYHHLQFGELDVDAHGLSALEPESDEAADDADRKTNALATRQDGNTGIAASSTGPEEPGVTTAAARPSLELASPENFPPLTTDGRQTDRERQQGYRYGDERATITNIAILDETGKRTVRELRSGGAYQLLMDIEVHEDLPRLYCGFLIRDVKGDTLFGMDTGTGLDRNAPLLTDLRKGERRRIVLSTRMWLASGSFFVTGAVAADEEKQSDLWFDAYEFHVVATPTIHSASRVNLQAQFSLFTL